MDAVKVAIVRYTDSSQPGWVEATLTDAQGHEWTFVEKVPIVSDMNIDGTTKYPQPGHIACVILRRRHDATGRAICIIDTTAPWGVASTTGKSEFEVWASQLSVLPSPYLWDAFKDGALFVARHQQVHMACREIGTINLSTGRIVACDPFSEIHARHFNQRVEPDFYGVFLAIANFGKYEQVAAAMILFGDELTPVRWELAAEAGDWTGRGGLTVDSSHGCLMDLKLARILSRKAASGRFERYERRIKGALAENGRPTWSWANVKLDENGGTNLVAFTTGEGDGWYPSFFGFSADGTTVCLITDLGLLDSR